MPERARALMIQGTASNAGKSLLAGGLCRVFRQDGWRVAPFKSQNMALNSFVTADGLEMGRAQAMQAECAGIPPDVRMNPVLLKPTGDTGSQVIVRGEVVGNLCAREYYRYRPRLLGPVLECYRSLAAEYDILVIEGAGSPAEINLGRDDFVNMGLAARVNAPVLLVGDIDRGGVFASLYGTHALLEPSERELIKGVIINKFRGDAALLRPGLGQLEELLGKPVLGVVPYLELDIDDEDSLSEQLHARPAPAGVDIAVLRLPRLSNFTDFAPLAGMEGVGLRYVGSLRELGAPDLIILPGTKNTMGDLLWLRQSGLEERILRHAAGGGAVVGICGGYQMLGLSLADPHGLEHGGSMEGMGLLPVRTTFSPQKRRAQIRGRFVHAEGLFSGLRGLPFTGYEIHMGDTALPAAPPALAELSYADGTTRPDGLCAGNVLGCYAHGLFDEPQVAAALIGALARAKGIGLSPAPPADRDSHKEAQYEKLAEALRSSLDIGKIYDIIEAGG